MNRLKVLMFGWEYPPAMYGGLGVACFGLCEALAPLVDLKLIIPKAVNEEKVNNMELIGMNHVDIRELADVSYSPDVELEPVISNLDPYFNSRRQKAGVAGVSSPKNNSEAFHIDALYGNDVIEKVIEFSALAVKVALTKTFDVIHAHDWMTFLAGMELKAATGKPLVLHVHSLEVDRNGETSRNRIYDLEKKALENADAIIAVSNYTARIIKEHYNIKADKIFPIHNAFEPVPAKNHEDRFPEPVVLFLGRVTQQKGPEFFVQVAKKVLEKIPDVRFVLAGSGNMMDEIIEQVAELGIGDRFHFTGFLNKEKVNELLAMTDIYCLPSVSEPFGLSALEAASYEIPCIISIRSGVSEVLNSSLKADFWDTDKMANYIIALVKSEKLRNQLVADAQSDLKNISWETAAKKVLSVYNSLINFKTHKT